MCNWESFLSLLPNPLRQEVDRVGNRSLQELRLRLGEYPELVTAADSICLNRRIQQQDLLAVINSASRFSPWAAGSMKLGYLTAEGGHRIGICGEAAENGVIRRVHSVCIRVARDVAGIAKGLPETGSVLILGAPGWGKTTLLRDLIRQRANTVTVGVTDERGELFPTGFFRGRRTDVITGVSKKEGIIRLLRTMGPGCLAVDEITEEADCHALYQAAGCGVTLLATAHAASVEDFRSRPVYRPLAEKRIFDYCVILDRQKRSRVERMGA